MREAETLALDFHEMVVTSDPDRSSFGKVVEEKKNYIYVYISPTEFKREE